VSSGYGRGYGNSGKMSAKIKGVNTGIEKCLL
jgi:hypothetical protein